MLKRWNIISGGRCVMKVGPSLEQSLKKDLHLIALLLSRCCWVSAAAPCPGGKGLPGVRAEPGVPSWDFSMLAASLVCACTFPFYPTHSGRGNPAWPTQLCFSGCSGVVQTRFPPAPVFNKLLFYPKQPQTPLSEKPAKMLFYFFFSLPSCSS